MGTLLTDERFAPYLQDAYYTQREDRYVLPVRTDGKGFVRGIVHGTSQSGQTLFIEPEEIVDLNNRAKLAEAEVARRGAPDPGQVLGLGRRGGRRVRRRRSPPPRRST